MKAESIPVAATVRRAGGDESSVGITISVGFIVGVGAAVCAGCVAAAALLQATDEIANRAIENTATARNLLITSGSTLRDLFDSLEVQHHVAAVLFLPAG